MLFSHGRLFPSDVYHQFYIQWPHSSPCFSFTFLLYSTPITIKYSSTHVFNAAYFSQPSSFDYLNHDCRTQFSFSCIQGSFLFFRINVPAMFIFKRDPSSREHLTRYEGRPSHVSCRAIDPITGFCLHGHLCCTLIYNSLTCTCRTINCLLSDNHSKWLGTQ